MLKLKFAALAALVLLSGLAAGANLDGRKSYIVQLGDAPAATYAGGVAGIAATLDGKSLGGHSALSW